MDECYLASTTGINASLGISGNVNVKVTLNGTTTYSTVSVGPIITTGTILSATALTTANLTASTSTTSAKFKTASNTAQALIAATPVAMFNVPTGFHLLYVWIDSSGANYQSVYAIKSDGITAVATAISAGASLTVTIVGSSPPVANITAPGSGTCKWAYETITA